MSCGHRALGTSSRLCWPHQTVHGFPLDLPRNIMPTPDTITPGNSVPRGLFRCLCHSTSGATPVEYALLLFAIIGLVATTVYLVGRNAQTTFADASQQWKASGGAPTSLREAAPKNARLDQRHDTASTDSAVQRRSSYRIAALSGALVLVLAVTWFVYRRRQRAPATPQPPSTEAERSNSAAPSRVEVQRQRLWRVLLNISDAVLKNQVTVQDLITREVFAVSPDARVPALREACEREQIRHLLVCDGEQRLLGVVSDRDLPNCDPRQTARQLMDARPKTLSPTTPLAAALSHMIDEGLSCLPVINGDTVCGVLTLTDVLLTLQCMLQFWLRVAKEVHNAPNWGEQLEATGLALDRDLADLEARLSHLEARPGPASRNRAGHSTPAEDTLAHDVDRIRQQLRHQMREMLNLLELRSDSLVGLSSPHELTIVLNMMCGIKTRHGDPFCLVLLAFDAPLGPGDNESGNRRLDPQREMAVAVAQMVRASDLMVRLRGDVMAIVLAKTELESRPGVLWPHARGSLPGVRRRVRGVAADGSGRRDCRRRPHESVAAGRGRVGGVLRGRRRRHGRGVLLVGNRRRDLARGVGDGWGLRDPKCACYRGMAGTWSGLPWVQA